MGDEDMTMVWAAEAAQKRRNDDVRRRVRQPGEDKSTQTENTGNLVPQMTRSEQRTTLLSYMAFTLVVGTLCQFKFFVTMETDHTNYNYILVSLILTLVVQSIIAVMLLYVSKREPKDYIESTLTFSLTLLIATVTFVNIVVFILV